MNAPLSVVLFSGGRGSSVLSSELLTHRDLKLTLAINGYDDGLSTGEVRRFLGDCLGPSDFRKNASHLARALRSCPGSLVDLLDRRLPKNIGREDALVALRAAGEEAGAARSQIAERLARFAQEFTSTGKPFDFADCSLGNLVFAGSFLLAARAFNAAVDDYCGLLGLTPGLIDNVTDGANAFLVAVDRADRLLASEAEIVDATRRNRIKDIFLLDRPLSPDEASAAGGKAGAELTEWLASRERQVAVNPRLLERVAGADLIIYSPGTQHSSLFPSYLTRGLSLAIARNLGAVKLLITNIQPDAELGDTTAVDIIGKAVYYLEEKGRLSLPTPCLITHYVINDPRRTESDASYVPLGRLESLEDPRLVRIGNYEDGVTGRHDPAKVLTPFIESLLVRRKRHTVAVWLHDCGSPNKVSQTLLEMARARVQDLPVAITVFYGQVAPVDAALTDILPFAVRFLGTEPGAAARFQQALADGAFDYAVLFESSGMYNGEDLASLAAHLTVGRLDAVWGSRRLSVRDIEASLRLRYRGRVWLRVASLVGSQLLSLSYLVLYGRYITDTLSGVRAIRARYVANSAIDLTDKLVNQRLLSTVLAERAEIFETPVQFYAMSPDQVRRTSVAEGFQSLAKIVWWRFTGTMKP